MKSHNKCDSVECVKQINRILDTLKTNTYNTSNVTRDIIKLLKEIDNKYDDALIYNFFENVNDAFKLLPYGYYLSFIITDVKNSSQILRSPLIHFTYKVSVASDNSFSYHYESQDLVTAIVLCSLHSLKNKLKNS